MHHSEANQEVKCTRGISEEGSERIVQDVLVIGTEEMKRQRRNTKPKPRFVGRGTRLELLAQSGLEEGLC